MLIVPLLRAVIVDHCLDNIGRPVQVKVGAEALNLHSSHVFHTKKLARLATGAEWTCNLEFGVFWGLGFLCAPVNLIADFNLNRCSLIGVINLNLSISGRL